MIGIDSHCLSYVIDAFSAVSAPTDNLAWERIALARLFFYLPGTLWVTPTVTAECARIRNVERANLHQSFIAVLFGEPPIEDPEVLSVGKPNYSSSVATKPTAEFWRKQSCSDSTPYLLSMGSSEIASPRTPTSNYAPQVTAGRLWPSQGERNLTKSPLRAIR